MRFQIGRLVGEQRVSAGVRFVKAVAGKFFHQIEDAFRLLLRNLVGSASRHELCALRGHLLFLFLAHRAAKNVRLAKRKTCQAIGDLHDLFLIQDDAVGFLENVLQLRKFVADLGFALLPVDEVVDHAALDGTGPVQSVQRGEVFDARGLVTAENVAHAVGLELEDGGRFGAGEEFISLCVIERKIVDISFHAAVLFDHADGIVKHREGREAEKIHFQQPDALQRIHVILRGDFIPIRLVHGDDVRQRPRRNHHASRMRGGVARQSFEPQRHGHQILQPFITVDGRFQLRRFFQRLLKFNPQRVRDQLR